MHDIYNYLRLNHTACGSRENAARIRDAVPKSLVAAGAASSGNRRGSYHPDTQSK
jgi:hypothetical protein